MREIGTDAGNLKFNCDTEKTRKPENRCCEVFAQKGKGGSQIDQYNHEKHAPIRLVAKKQQHILMIFQEFL